MRQFLAHIEALKREEEMRREPQVVSYVNPLHQIIDELDGNYHGFMFDSPTDSESKTQEDRDELKVLVGANVEDVGKTSVSHGKDEKTSVSHGKDELFTKTACFDEMNESPSKQQVTFKDCFDINVNNEQNDKKERNKKVRKYSQSSILLGDVEDASDSECEDEFNDFMHTRRPAPGQWIEPIECSTYSAQIFKK